jgi:hypothetical protein
LQSSGQAADYKSAVSKCDLLRSASGAARDGGSL